jgi:hypothetical protein
MSENNTRTVIREASFVVVRQPCHPLPPLCLCPSHREKVRHSTSRGYHPTIAPPPTLLSTVQPSLVQLYFVHRNSLFACYSFLHLNFFTLHKQFKVSTATLKLAQAQTKPPFGSFRGPSQSLILSSRDRDNTAQKQDLGTDSANKRRNRVDDKTCPLRRQLTWD